MMKVSMLAFVAACLVSRVAMGQAAYASGKIIGKLDGLQHIACIAAAKNGKLLVAADGNVRVYDSRSGKCVRSFSDGLATRIILEQVKEQEIGAVTSDDKTIYVLATRNAVVETEGRNRKYKTPVSVGGICKRFSWEGKFLGELLLQDIKNVSHARLLGDRIYVSDNIVKVVRVYDLKTGAQLGSLGQDIRLCGCTFHFSIDPTTKEVLVANVGAFKVQRYASNGVLKFQFGQRGPNAGDFQGNCNPIACERLPNGNVVTLEKDPANLKVFKPDGTFVHSFPGLSESLREGKPASLTVDTRGCVYLAVNGNGVNVVHQFVPAKQP